MKPGFRQKARQLALQGLYSWSMTGNDIQQIELDLAKDNNMKDVDTEYFQELLEQVTRRVDTLDTTLKPYLGRLPEELDPIEKAILRISTYELLERVDVPFKVIINEAIELAKTFGAEESHKFINGALDKAVKTLRKHERK